ncbi:MAG: fibronectin type III domain-containing protein, partial [Candidatus Nanopelagicales bacterium]
ASEAVQSPTQIICKTQAGKAGLVDVTVKNPSGATGTLPQGFTYVSGNLPTAPQAVTALFNNKTDIITVTWQAPANQGGSAIVRYTATATDNNAKTPDLSCTTPNGTTLTCKIQVGNPGPRYNVTVTATNGAGTGPASAPPVDVQTK